jgi:hypothetical protein
MIEPIKNRVTAVYDTLVVKPHICVRVIQLWFCGIFFLVPKKHNAIGGYPNPNQEDLILEIKRDYMGLNGLILFDIHILGPKILQFDPHQLPSGKLT